MKSSHVQARGRLPINQAQGIKNPIAVLLQSLRDVFILPWPKGAVIKPIHCMAISGNYRNAGDVETETAVLDGASDGSSQNQNCAG